MERQFVFCCPSRCLGKGVSGSDTTPKEDHSRGTKAVWKGTARRRTQMVLAANLRSHRIASRGKPDHAGHDRLPSSLPDVALAGPYGCSDGSSRRGPASYSDCVGPVHSMEQSKSTAEGKALGYCHCRTFPSVRRLISPPTDHRVRVSYRRDRHGHRLGHPDSRHPVG